jgi:hypothetical protein
MTNDELTSKMHSMLHKAPVALCATDWSEMTGDDVARKCPDCGGMAFAVTQMDPAAFFSEAAKYESVSGRIRAFRRLDGTYTFAELNCSPKKLLAPLKSDLRGVRICNWWSDRVGRYNKYLSLYGLAVGGAATVMFLVASPSWIAVICFLSVGLVSAFAANVLFAACMIANLIVPGFLASVRKNSGPVLLMGSMAAMGGVMTIPLIFAIFVLGSQLFSKRP